LLFQETRILKTWYQLQEMHTKRELAKLGKPVDKSEWFTTPSTVTAYNNPQMKSSFQQVFYSLLILIMRPMTLLTMEVSEW
jgi:predicted metalloendopeptidase